jgi:hypothetical protein
MATEAIRIIGVKIVPGVTRDILKDQPHAEARHMAHITIRLNQTSLTVVVRKAPNFPICKSAQALLAFS